MCFYGVFLCLFWCLKEAKTCRETRKTAKIHKNVFLPWSEECLGLFTTLTCFSRRRPLYGRQPQNSSNWVDLDTLEKILIFSF